jgi:hypothetical protein
MTAFAENTSVPVERSRAEIEGLLRKYGADQFASGWDEGRAMIGFRCQGRFIRFLLVLPDPTEKRFTTAHYKRRISPTIRTARQAQEACEAELRRRWRALALVIKAKLEAVSTGITTFENEFMAHIVLPDGKTVGQHVGPMIGDAYTSGKVRPLLLPEWTS